ncbi:MAG: response regulator, partial [Candidatus Wallbacteria bacterium]|nr:response regulator [Candidatus Wallbacteria bacterium]
ANLRISVANRRFGEFFGLDPVQVIGMDDNDVRLAVLGCFKDPEGFQKRVGELYSDPGAEGEDEVELARPVPRILQRSSGPVRDPRGLVLGRLWIFRDVTARLRMERELEEKARLIAESDRLKSQFLATTSHELRTPLNSLLGFLKLILEGVCETPEEERSLISYAYNTGTHLATLLNDILDLAKIESGSVPLNMDWIEIGKLLGEVLPICAVQAQAKSISCEHSELPADLPLVNADYLRLRQVMLNLIGNAIKYTATGGVRLEIDWSPGSPSLSLRVTDTGIGMDSAVLAGARTGEFTSRTRRGVGSLGLSIARRYLALMGGSLDLASPGANEGTTARITLQARPCDGAVRERESSGNSPRPRAALAAGLAVLVVEDDLPSAQAVRMALERLGNYKVTESEDVARILALARTGEIEAILMDVSLSRSRHEGRLLDGLEITRMLKADELTRHIPVVLMTAHAMAGDRERMLRESGADAYESKPILDFHSLMARLAALVRRAAD